MKRYLAFDLGCQECGEPSGVIGLYATKRAAEAACDRAYERQEKVWGGQHTMQVFDLASPADVSAYADEKTKRDGVRLEADRKDG